MKPIEIHIEGYKIIITKDEDDKESITYMPKEKDDNLIDVPKYPHTIPCPYVPPTIQPTDDWWKDPTVTWTNDDVLTNTTTTYPTPIRDRMVGKTTIADGGTISVELTPEQIANAPKNDPVGEKGVPGCNDGMCKIDYSQFKSNSGE